MESHSVVMTDIASSELFVFSDPRSTAAAAAAWIADRAAAATHLFRVALSGGTTPGLLYEELASRKYRSRIEWRRLELFWGDERFVPHNDPRSNYRMARETLLAHAPVLIDHVYPIPTDGDLDNCARRYEALLKGIYGGDPLALARPLFDLVLLGLGADGHTASLLPGTEALNERTRCVAPVENGDPPRITLTYPAIRSSAAVLFLVTGREKADVLQRVREGDASLPATRIQSMGEIVWFVDRDAAAGLAEAA